MVETILPVSIRAVSCFPSMHTVVSFDDPTNFSMKFGSGTLQPTV